MAKTQLPIPPPPPPLSDTIFVPESIDFRGTTLLDKTKLVFNSADFAQVTFSSTQFGFGLISDSLAVTGNDFRTYINVFLDNGDTIFSAAGWTFSDWVPFTPLQNDQVNINGSEAGDFITGSKTADILIGNGGDDTLLGIDGRDYLIGGAGTDTLMGGADDDQYVLRDIHQVSQLPLRFAFDTVSEFDQGGIDQVQLYRVDGWGRYTLPGFVENGIIFGTFQNGVLTSSNMGVFALTGNGLSNTLVGNEDINTLNGLDGSDTLNGKGGNDTLDGGRGADTLDGGNGIDTASYASADAGVTVSLAIIGPQNTGAGADSLFSIENLIGSGFADTLTGDDADNDISGGGGADVIAGGKGNDALQGGGGADQISGGAGIDRITGGTGNDTLTGGGGEDVFVFGPGSGRDTIINFADVGGATDDHIDVSAYQFQKIGQIGRSASGDDLVLTFAPGDTLVIRDYLATHGINAIIDDIYLLA